MNHNAGVIKSAGLMHNRRGQELPMQTIVMIIIVLLVLAGVGVFFFQQFATGQKGTGSAQCIQLCQSLKAQMSSNSSVAWNDMSSASGSKAEFISSGCCAIYDCQVRKAAGDTAYSDAC